MIGGTMPTGAPDVPDELPVVRHSGIIRLQWLATIGLRGEDVTGESCIGLVATSEHSLPDRAATSSLLRGTFSADTEAMSSIDPKDSPKPPCGTSQLLVFARPASRNTTGLDRRDGSPPSTLQTTSVAADLLDDGGLE